MRLDVLAVAKVIVLLFVLQAWSEMGWAQSGSDPGLTPLTIETAAGKVDFTVEVATTPAQKMQGLMFRQSLPKDGGMLFDYGAPRSVAMWMKNTYIPLDLLFIGGDGRIVNIVERAVPHSLATIPSDGPVRAVLEVNGGTVSRLGIAPGDRVAHGIFSD
ncbi:MAG: DUF192 domain-containing protein [Alphaproteobacteria bacterium]|nr:DUF192 domain-containing protein [Alphaproteobacteria bacterium]